MNESSIDTKQKIYSFFDSLVYFIFSKRISFDIEEHRFIKNAYVILLPPEGEMINHVIGRQGRMINALNVIVSTWAFQNKIIVYVKQKRKENTEGNQ